MIRAVVFDVGGTMHTSREDALLQQSFSARALKLLSDGEIQLGVSPDEFYGTLRRTAEEYKAWSEESGRELPSGEIWGEYFLRPYKPDRALLDPLAEELSFLYDDARSRIVPRPNLERTVAAICGMGLKTGVISNIISLNYVPAVLERYGIARYMSCVVLSSVAGIRKPWPGIFRIAEGELGLAPEELAYVGDTLSRDVIGARNAGWRLMIQISNPSIAFRDRKVQNSGYKPDFLISGLEEIPGIIARENGV
ncbi:MAG TPA: HAD family hydrolase [Clostridia bacterium]|nr:HAD family hydrolase [Clostridia bacterium]